MGAAPYFKSEALSAFDLRKGMARKGREW